MAGVRNIIHSCHFCMFRQGLHYCQQQHEDLSLFAILTAQLSLLVHVLQTWGYDRLQAHGFRKCPLEMSYMRPMGTQTSHKRQQQGLL